MLSPAIACGQVKLGERFERIWKGDRDGAIRSLFYSPRREMESWMPTDGIRSANGDWRGKTDNSWPESVRGVTGINFSVWVCKKRLICLNSRQVQRFMGGRNLERSAEEEDDRSLGWIVSDSNIWPTEELGWKMGHVRLMPRWATSPNWPSWAFFRDRCSKMWGWIPLTKDDCHSYST